LSGIRMHSACDKFAQVRCHIAAMVSRPTDDRIALPSSTDGRVRRYGCQLCSTCRSVLHSRRVPVASVRRQASSSRFTLAQFPVPARAWSSGPPVQYHKRTTRQRMREHAHT
jgi:hypothetical protein